MEQNIPSDCDNRPADCDNRQIEVPSKELGEQIPQVASEYEIKVIIILKS